MRNGRLVNKYKAEKRYIREFDKVLLFCAICLVLYGILNIYIATKGEKFLILGPYYFGVRQSIWFAISLCVL